MYGFWMDTGPFDGHSFDLFGYLEDNDFSSLSRFTTGINYKLKAGSFGLIAEGAFQGGTQTIGSGVFLPGEVMKNYYKAGDTIREDPGFWLFTMIMFKI